MGGHWQAISTCNYASLINMGSSQHHFEKVRLITRNTKTIDDLEKATILNETAKKGLIAEVKMARGWTMYYLLHLYGPLPIILDPAKIGTSAESDMKRPSAVSL